MNYEIQNEYIKAVIDSGGAQLNSLKKNDEDLDYIWCADESYWNRSSPILFPIVGKLKDDEYIYDNKKYSMNQHGFARDKKFEVVKKEDDCVEFKLTSSKKSKDIYPFDFELFLNYQLKENKLIVSYKVINIDTKVLYFSIGAHPAFNWPLEDEAKDECFISVDKKEAYRYFLKDGLLADNTYMNCEKIFLSEEMFFNDALVFNDDINEVTFQNSRNDRFVKMNFKDFPYLGIWSKPSGSPFLCIEPWHGVADSVDHNKKLEDKRGILSLDSKNKFESSYSIEI